MAPVIRALRTHPARFEVDLCVVAQQREVLIGRSTNGASGPTGGWTRDRRQAPRAPRGCDARGGKYVSRAARADIVLVHGDTSTALATSLAAFYAGVPFGHVEAGLRTSDLGAPFPEELHRVVIDRMAAVHYAPTARARRNLLAEGCSDETIAVVGNTVVDALRSIPSRACAPEPGDVSVHPGHRPSARELRRAAARPLFGAADTRSLTGRRTRRLRAASAPVGAGAGARNAGRPPAHRAARAAQLRRFRLVATACTRGADRLGGRAGGGGVTGAAGPRLARADGEARGGRSGRLACRAHGSRARSCGPPRSCSTMGTRGPRWRARRTRTATGTRRIASWPTSCSAWESCGAPRRRLDARVAPER